MTRFVFRLYAVITKLGESLNVAKAIVKKTTRFSVFTRKVKNGKVSFFKRIGSGNSRKETCLHTENEIRQAWETSMKRMQAASLLSISWKSLENLEVLLHKKLKRQYQYINQHYLGIPHNSHDTKHPEGLIHKTARGELVRSKSEVIIANALHAAKIDYYYEYPYEVAEGTRGICYPDFTIPVSIQGQTVYWEHCGMTNNPDYLFSWMKKKRMYQEEGILENINLIVTYDSYTGDIDSYEIQSIIEKWFVIQ